MNRKFALIAVAACTAMIAFTQNASAGKRPLPPSPSELLPGQEFTLDHPLGSPSAERNYLFNNGYIESCCQFFYKHDAGGQESNPFITVTELSGSQWQVTWDFTGTGMTLCGALIKDGSVNGQQLYSFFGVTPDEAVAGSGVVSFTNGRNISHISFFVCGAGVPDGGATVMLLGVALGTLGMVRRYLKS
jgi:hypothetical protein